MSRQTKVALIFTGLVMLGVPFFALGVLLCLTLVGAIIGLPLMWLSAMPAYLYIKRHYARVDARRFAEERAQQKPTNGVPPWLLPSAPDPHAVGGRETYRVDEWGNVLEEE